MEPWDGVEPYGDYLERIHRSPGQFQQGGEARPGFDIFGMPLPTAAAPAGPPAGSNPADQSARAIIEGALAEYGLGALADRLWQRYLTGTPLEAVMLDLRKEPEYRARFPYMEALAKKGRAINEAQAIDLERSFTQIARSFGLPPTFYDQPDDFTRYIENEQSPREYAEKLALWSRASLEFASRPEAATTMAEMQRLYGIGPGTGEFLAWFIDPDRAAPILEQQFAAGTLGATARRTGYGELSRTEAERLASLGITEDAAAKGFGELARSSELMLSLDAGEDTIDRATGQAAVFEGNAAAIERLNRRAERRRAAFAGGGGFATTQRGVSGLGSAAS